MPSKVATSRSAVGPHAECPALLTKTSMSPTCSASRRISPGSKVGREETCLAAGPFNLLDGLRSALGVASVHDHLETVGGQLQGDRTSDTGRRAGHERFRGMDVGHIFAPPG